MWGREEAGAWGHPAVSGHAIAGASARLPVRADLLAIRIRSGGSSRRGEGRLVGHSATVSLPSRGRAWL
jgi:hypothetical protein